MVYDLAKKYGKLVNGSLEIVSVMKNVFDESTGTFTFLPKTDVEMQGAKEIVIGQQEYPQTPYDDVYTTYEETETTIEVTYHVREKTAIEINQINEQFWNDNFTKIDLENNLYICNWFTDKAGGISETINDIYPVLVTRSVIYGMMTPEQLAQMPPNAINVFRAPNLQQKLTQEYIVSLIEVVTDPLMLASILQKMGEIQADVDRYPSIM